MRYFLSFIFLISTSFMTYPVFTNTGNYIVYETGLVIPPGAENISFNFVGIEIENEIEEMIELRKNLFKSKIFKTITLKDFLGMQFFGVEMYYEFLTNLQDLNKITNNISKQINKKTKKAFIPIDGLSGNTGSSSIDTI